MFSLDINRALIISLSHSPRDITDLTSYIVLRSRLYAVITVDLNIYPYRYCNLDNYCLIRPTKAKCQSDNTNFRRTRERYGLSSCCGVGYSIYRVGCLVCYFPRKKKNNKEKKEEEEGRGLHIEKRTARTKKGSGEAP